MTESNFIGTAVSNQDEYSQYPRVTRKINRNIIPVSIDQFKKRAAKKHNNKYDYSLVQFTMLTDRVTIICPEHGEFKKTVSAHLKRGHCPNCAYALRGQNKEQFVRTCGGDLAVLYAIKCWYQSTIPSKSEVFYKIGITSKTTNMRFGNRTVMPYNYEILYEVKNDADAIYDLEKILHKLLDDYSYKPKKRFGGDTECFSTINPVLFLLDKMKAS